jgi:hypothetical protein
VIEGIYVTGTLLAVVNWLSLLEVEPLLPLDILTLWNAGVPTHVHDSIR